MLALGIVVSAPWKDEGDVRRPVRAGTRSLRKRAQWRLRRLPARVQPHSRYFQRTSTYFSEPLAMLLWGCMCLVCVAALIGFGILVGGGASLLPVTKTLHHDLSVVSKPAVALPIATAILIAIGWFLRGARLAWLAWRPGPIIVADFKLDAGITDTTPEKLTAVFRDGLSLLRLDSAVSSPGAPPEKSFLDVLNAGTVSTSNFLATLLTLLRASLPTHTFEIHGLIQRREDPPCCGVTVRAVRLPGEAAGLVEAWDSTWEGAARQAADGAVAALLPRTRYCRGPWAAWQHFAAPAELFTAYREAAYYEQNRRYDEALGRYLDALQLDPTNLTVRLHLGQLQEKIGHLIGALTTYQRILALNNPGARVTPRGLYRRTARREWERVVRIAKYRQIVLLGAGSLVDEWYGHFEGEPPDYRRGLRQKFRGQLRPLAVRRGDPTTDIISEAIAKLIEIKRLDDESAGALDELLDATAVARVVAAHQLELIPYAYKAGYELQRTLSRLELHPWRGSLSRRTVGLTLACIRMRGRLALRVGSPDHPDAAPGEKLVEALDSELFWTGLRPFPWFGWRPPLVRRWTWQQHYTAACLYAIPLALADDDQRHGKHSTQAAPPLDEGTVDELARKAVHRLERAAARADIEFAATRRDWVLEEDPDLSTLRARPEFTAFAAQYFPDRSNLSEPAEPAPTVRDSRTRVTENAYAHSLLVTLATRWHALWHDRAARGASVDAHTLLDWWTEEQEVWSMFSGIAKAPDDWRGRLDLLTKANEVIERDGGKPITASYGRVGASSAASQVRLDELGAAFATGSPFAPDFERRLELLRLADAEALAISSPARTELLCRRQSALWLALTECLSGEAEVAAMPVNGRALERVRGRLSAVDAVWYLAELPLQRTHLRPSRRPSPPRARARVSSQRWRRGFSIGSSPGQSGSDPGGAVRARHGPTLGSPEERLLDVGDPPPDPSLIELQEPEAAVESRGVRVDRVHDDAPCCELARAAHASAERVNE